MRSSIVYSLVFLAFAMLVRSCDQNGDLRTCIRSIANGGEGNCINHCDINSFGTSSNTLKCNGQRNTCSGHAWACLNNLHQTQGIAAARSGFAGCVRNDCRELRECTNFRGRTCAASRVVDYDCGLPN